MSRRASPPPGAGRGQAAALNSEPLIARQQFGGGVDRLGDVVQLIIRDVSVNWPASILERSSTSLIRPSRCLPLLSTRLSTSWAFCGASPQKAQGVLERVQSNGRHLLGLINDVLDLSKIEAGQLVAGDRGLQRRRHGSDGHARPPNCWPAPRTSSSAPPPCASGLPTGTGDALRLAQVLLNLVGNAIKFTDPGAALEISPCCTGRRLASKMSVV